MQVHPAPARALGRPTAVPSTVRKGVLAASGAISCQRDSPEPARVPLRPQARTMDQECGANPGIGFVSFVSRFQHEPT